MKKRKRKFVESRESFFDDLSPHTKQAIGAVIFVALAVFFTFALFHYAGIAGDFANNALDYLFGVGRFLPPFVCLLFVYVLLRPRDDERVSLSKSIGIMVAFLSLLGMISLGFEEGGLVGDSILWPLAWLFGGAVSGVLLTALMLIGIFLTFNTNFISIFVRNKEEEVGALTDTEAAISVPPLTPEEIAASAAKEDGAGESEEPTSKKTTISERIGLGKASADFTVSNFRGTYAPPPLSLLNKDRGKPDAGDVKENMSTIKRTLKKFGIDVEIDSVTPGSTFTQYAIKPAEGVKLEKIVSLQNNLAYALAASPIRIEAPIPGKSLVGIEVPNKHRQTVGLASIFNSPEYTDSPKPLLTVLGKDITGHPDFADIARMPHGLIAGTTGSGKSVAIHNIIISLLFRNSPDQLRFIMVDPKLVELTLYNDIPHLLTPVITDAKRVILALKWAIKEMDRRLEILRENRVQNVESYHKEVYQPAKAKFEGDGSPEEERDALPEALPYIVVIIDELADLMSQYPKELEACIVRLAQKSRAIGIHLILATQRPEVKVITGLIKANMPTRIALKVNTLIDSRTILDQSGAEKLLGKGDMLFLSQESPSTKRLQSAFVTTDEVKKVVQYLKDQGLAPELDAIPMDQSGKGSGDTLFSGSLDDDEEGDELYEEAKQIVIGARKASTSFLQRKLSIGYGRAAKIIDLLEERGVVGPGEGSKPRQVLVGEGAETGDDEIENREY